VAVEWTNAVGVTVSGGSLTKTAGSAWGNAGAASLQSLLSGDGAVSFTASETDTYRMLGLSHGDSDLSYSDLDYGLYLIADGRVLVYERGIFRGNFGIYSSGDWFQVAVVSGATPSVQYSRNGVVFYTSTIAPTYPLLVDSALYSSGATLTDAILSGTWETPPPPPPPPPPPTGVAVEWTNAVGVAVSDGSLTKTAASAWGNAGAASVQSLASGDGAVSFTASETNTYRMLGLSHGDSDQNYGDLDYGLYLIADGRVLVYEGGISRGGFGIYSSGDWFQVAVVSGATPSVQYSRNGVVFYTSTVVPTYPLLVDTALYSHGATLTDAIVSGGFD
jgi:hypothetical protein